MTPETALATQSPNGLARQETAIARFTEQDIEVINNTIAKDLTPGERAFFIQACQSTGLNPIMKEIHVWKEAGKLCIHVGIDGLCKTAAENHADYCGIEGPQWCGEDGIWRDFWPKSKGNPCASRVRVLLRGARTGWTTVMWDNFAKPNQYGKIGMWEKMPAHMLGCAALRHAMRRTCPRALKQIDLATIRHEDDGPATVTEHYADVLPTGEPQAVVYDTPAQSQAEPMSYANVTPPVTQPQPTVKTQAATPAPLTPAQEFSQVTADCMALYKELGGTTPGKHMVEALGLPPDTKPNEVDLAGRKRYLALLQQYRCLPGQDGWPQGDSDVLEAEIVEPDLFAGEA